MKEENTKLKVMHILNTGSFSGAENVAISIINNTKREVDSIYVSLQGTIEDVLKKNRIQYYLMGKLSKKNLTKIIRKEKPDIIHAHDFTASVVAASSSRNIPIVSHLHNNPPWIKKVNIKTLIYLFTCDRYKKVLAVSDAVFSEYIFRNSIIRKGLVIGNPIMTEQIRKKAKEGKCQCSFDILFIGRFTLQKNPEMFVDIVKEVRKHIPSVKAGMVGTGEMLDSIKKKIMDNQLESTIKCMGFLDNPYDVLNNSKVLCIPSKWEGFGLVAVEALALGKPVVASNVGGLPDIVVEKTGKICIVLEEYVEEITKLLSDSSYYEKKSEGARKRADDIDNENEYYCKLINCYQECMERKERTKVKC